MTSRRKGSAFAYLQSPQPLGPGTFSLTSVTVPQGTSTPLFELERVAGASMTWHSPGEIVVSGRQDGEQKTWTVDLP